VARAAAQVADGSEASCTSPLRLGGCWSWSGWPATRGSALGPRPPRCCRPTRAAAGRASGSAAGRGSAPGWSCRTCPGRGCGSPGAGDGRGRPVPSSRWRRRWSLRSPAASCAPAPGADARPSRRSPAGTWRLRAGVGWAELAGGGGGGPSGSVRGRSRGEARRALVDPVLPRLASGRCCRSRSRLARRRHWPRCAGC
jgi:hypothetical protein